MGLEIPVRPADLVGQVAAVLARDLGAGDLAVTGAGLLSRMSSWAEDGLLAAHLAFSYQQVGDTQNANLLIDNFEQFLESRDVKIQGISIELLAHG